MSTLFEVETKGFERLALINSTLQKVTNPEFVADEAGAILLNRIRTRFLDQVDPDGVEWKESQAAKNRKISGRGGGTLFDTGRLFHSIQLFKRDTGVRSIATDVPYAKTVQTGPPARIFMGLSSEDTQVVKVLIQKRIDEALEGNG